MQIPRKVQVVDRTVRDARDTFLLRPTNKRARDTIPYRATRKASQGAGCRVEQVASTDTSGIYILPNGKRTAQSAEYLRREVQAGEHIRPESLHYLHTTCQADSHDSRQRSCVPPRHPLTNNKQVEDTLNNSNDLFLTFRKEMEEMSKKTKRLEKENMQLTRKQEATNKNIFQMAEERSHSQKEIDRLARENEKLKKLCRAMQTNGYGRADMVSEGVEGEEDLGETDSEYDEYEEDDDGSIEGEYDEDTEEEPIQVQQTRTYGPVPPPPPPPQQDVPNGNVKGQVQVNGINGGRH